MRKLRQLIIRLVPTLGLAAFLVVEGAGWKLP